MNLLRGIVLLSLLIILSACEQTTSLLGTSGTLSADPTDPCHQQRQNFADGQNYFARAILTKAAQGAISGAMPNLMSGNMSGVWGNVANGMFSGVKAGYWDALQQQNRDQQQLAQSMNADLQRESQAIDHTTAAFGTLRSCRLAQATHIKNDARAHHIDRAEAQRELKQQHDWFTEEIKVAENAGINMQKRDDQFAYAADSLHKENAKGPTARARSKSEQAVTISATETIPQKRNTFESSVKEAQAESSTAFSLDSSAAAKEHRYA